jgi:MraZ protein
MFRGNALAKVDEKGRLKLPAMFRQVIEAKYGTEFFVTSLRGECVLVYPMEVWERIEEKLARLSQFEPPVIKFKNAVNYFGQGACLDNQGRILIHPHLRKLAATEDDVAVLGHQDHLEVWNRAAFEERLNNEPLTDTDLAALAERGL